MELKVHLQIFPHKSERWIHGTRLMVAVLGDIDLP
ncbi:hypothetical protein NC651_027947 [Populus alba x Populus x berolinensis]|nr:hypothetical protein NC651_027947 [Populus alba x Populus x berolinensis]